MKWKRWPPLQFQKCVAYVFVARAIRRARSRKNHRLRDAKSPAIRERLPRCPDFDRTTRLADTRRQFHLSDNCWNQPGDKWRRSRERKSNCSNPEWANPAFPFAQLAEARRYPRREATGYSP